MSFFGFVAQPNSTFNVSILLFRWYSLAAIANHALEDLQHPLVVVYPATISVLHRDLHRQVAQERNLSIYAAPSPTLLLWKATSRQLSCFLNILILWSGLPLIVRFQLYFIFHSIINLSLEQYSTFTPTWTSFTALLQRCVPNTRVQPCLLGLRESMELKQTIDLRFW
jgi:hypothetical protein